MVFALLGFFSFASIFLCDALFTAHLIGPDTADGWGMGVGLVLTPLFVLISIGLGIWRGFRKWSGADEPVMGLSLSDNSKRD